MSPEGVEHGPAIASGEIVSKKAQVYSVRIPAESGFAWKWRSADGRKQSPGAFVYFFDCVQDAKKSGYVVDMVPVHGSTAPGNIDGQGVI
jgi:hypothetical protein